MVIFLILLAVLSCWNIKPQKAGIHEDYMSIEQTTAIRGILACIIFCSHLRDYLVFSTPVDQLYVKILYTIGQCMVAPFFFYSGYGIVLSYQKKKNYGNGFLRKRLGLTWLHFAVAVVLFYVVDCVLGISYSFPTFLVSLTGWSDVGNSNWFMFVTFALYLIVWFSMKAAAKVHPDSDPRERSQLLVVLITLMSAILLGVLAVLKQSWWFDTLLSFTFGGFYCLAKDQVDAFCRKSWNWLALTAAVLVLFFLFHRSGGYAAYNVCACLFVMLISCLTMKLRIVNPILMWLGKHSFYIYIYMRIPMIIMRQLEILTDNNYLFAVVSLAITCAIAWCMNLVHKHTDQYFLSKV